MKKRLFWVILALSAFIVTGCTTQTGTSGDEVDNNFKLYVSDAPADIGDFESLEVTFSEARVFSGEGWEIINLTDTIELTELIGEKVEEIAMVNLEPGTYTKIELYVENIVGTVSGEEAEVMVPSNKLQITKSFTVTNESVTEFVFDINVVKKGQQLSYNLLPNIAKSGLKEDHDAAEAEEMDDEKNEEEDFVDINGNGIPDDEEEEDINREDDEEVNEGETFEDENGNGIPDDEEGSNQSDENGTGELDIQISDAPAAIEDFESLLVHIYEARVFPEGERWVMYDNLSETVDLTNLVGDVSESILTAELAAGNYTKVELYVDNVTGIMAEEEKEIKLPSDKLQITVPFKIVAGQETTFIFDINVVAKGNGGYNLLPNIGESGEVEEGDMQEVECSADVSCEGLSVCQEGVCVAIECLADEDCTDMICSENLCVEAVNTEGDETIELNDSEENETEGNDTIDVNGTVDTNTTVDTNETETNTTDGNSTEGNETA